MRGVYTFRLRQSSFICDASMFNAISSIPGVCGQIGPYAVAVKLSSHEEMSIGFSSLLAVAKGIPKNSQLPDDEMSPVMEPRLLANDCDLFCMKIR